MKELGPVHNTCNYYHLAFDSPIQQLTKECICEDCALDILPDRVRCKLTNLWHVLDSIVVQIWRLNLLAQLI